MSAIGRNSSKPLSLLTSGLERWQRTQSRTMRELPWASREKPLEPLWKPLLAAAVISAVMVAAYVILP